MSSFEDTCPSNLIEVLRVIKDNAPHEVIEDFTAADESAAYHFSMGRYMRNTWSMWADRDKPAPNALVSYFWKYGVYHADDMSGIITDSLHRWLNDKPIDLKSQIAHYMKFWTTSTKKYGGDGFLEKKLKEAYNNKELWKEE